MSKKPEIRITFHVTPEEAAVLDEEAKQFGFQSRNLYARALMQTARGKHEFEVAMERVISLGKTMEKNAIHAVLSALGSMTEEDLTRFPSPLSRKPSHGE